MKKLTIAVLSISFAFLVIAGTPRDSYAGESGVINGCYNKATGAFRILPPCISSQMVKCLGCTIHETPISWNQQGQAGEPGVANGISQAVHGTVPRNVVSGTQYATYFVGHTSIGQYFIFFDTPFPGPPDCSVTVYKTDPPVVESCDNIPTYQTGGDNCFITGTIYPGSFTVTCTSPIPAVSVWPITENTPLCWDWRCTAPQWGQLPICTTLLYFPVNTDFSFTCVY